MGDVLFNTIVKWQGLKPWGKVLDAGTGVHSLKWILNMPTDSVTAITADNAMKRQIESTFQECGLSLRPCDSVIVGNWIDDEFCSSSIGANNKFDTILADYLIGAVDGFSPYTQDVIIQKLRNHLAPSGRLYIVGMEPIPDHAVEPAEIITEVRRARDACIQLAGHRPYREYPLSWMSRTLQKSALDTRKVKKFTILHNEDSILRQLKVAQNKVPLLSPILRSSIENYLLELRYMFLTDLFYYFFRTLNPLPFKIV
jgi:hypothetical protein